MFGRAYGVSCRARAEPRYAAIRWRFAPETWVPRSPAPAGDSAGRPYHHGPRGLRARILAAVSDAEILRRVREVPEGFVRTYGDVSPGAPRAAGAALHKAHDPRLP